MVASTEGEIMVKSDLNGYEYTYPVFRYGRICQAIKAEKFIFDQASEIQTTFKEKRDILKEKIKKCFEHQGISCDYINKEDIEKNKKGYYAELLEGPAVLFEHLKLQLDGLDVEFRPSLTICVYPNHSKIWMRYSYNKKPFTLNKSETKQFFDLATNASREIADLLVDEYKQILLEKNFCENLKSIHTILIKTTSTDDSILKNLISNFEINIRGVIANNMQKEENDELKKQFLFFASEKSYSNAEWFGIEVNNSAAIYAKFNKKDLTEFVGIGINLKGSVVPYEKSVPHKVSRALIKVIAPSI